MRLVLSITLSMVILLIKKGIITGDEFINELEKTMDPNDKEGKKLIDEILNEVSIKTKTTKIKWKWESF